MTGRPRRATLLAVAISSALLAFAFASTSASAAVNPMMSTNYEFSCGLKNNGTISCFGDNDQGQLGNGTFDQSFIPVQVSGITNAVAIATSDETACALLADTSVRCWGQGGDGELGDGPSTDSNVPVQPAGLTAVKALTALDYSFCAHMIDNTVKCWGAQENGQFGTGDTNDVVVPTTVPGLTNVAKVSNGQDVLCAIITGGTVKCLGDDSDGGLGNGLPLADSTTAVDVSGITNAIDIAVGDESACALLASTQVVCWGESDEGQTGNGDVTGADQPEPVTALLPSNVITIRPGYDNACAVTADNKVFCWGNNEDGQAGDGSSGNDKFTPVQVQNLGPFADFAQQFEAAPCVIRAGGAVACWGSNGYGEAGDGNISTADILSPREISNLNLTPVPFASAQNTISTAGKATVDRKKRFYTRNGSFSMQPSVYSLQSVACSGLATFTTKYRYTAIKIVKRKGKRVRKKVKKTKTVRTTAPMVPSGANCAANFSLKKLPVKFLNNKTITIDASFPGNAALEPATASLKTKLPKVKFKKKR